MLFLAIVLVFLIYAGLYIIWDAARISLDAPHTILRSFSEAVLMPDNTVFMILRGVLALAFLYLVADYLMSSTRRAVKKARRNKELQAEKENAGKLRATFREQPDQSL